jgi:hypothetical protein
MNSSIYYQNKNKTERKNELTIFAEQCSLNSVFLQHFLILSLPLDKMNVEDLLTHHQLSPNISNLRVSLDYPKKIPDILSKFTEIKTLSFEGKIELSSFIEFLKTLNPKNKLEKIIFPQFEKTTKEDILEFHKILFDKTNLIYFENLFLPFESMWELILPWIESNTRLKELDLNFCSILFFTHRF